MATRTSCEISWDVSEFLRATARIRVVGHAQMCIDSVYAANPHHFNRHPCWVVLNIPRQQSVLQIRDKDGGEEDNKDEAIVPTDMNLICDDDLRLILSHMAKVRFVALAFCPSSSCQAHTRQVAAASAATVQRVTDSTSVATVARFFYLCLFCLIPHDQGCTIYSCMLQ